MLTLRTTASSKGKTEGGWDSIHVFEEIDRGRTAHYKLTSTVILHLATSNDSLGQMDLSGNMTRQIEQEMAVDDDSSHIVNVGKLVEDMELKMRNLLRKLSLTEYVTCPLLTLGRGSVFWKGKGRCGRPSEHVANSCMLRTLLIILGVPPLTEANRDKATHQDMINSLKR